MNFKTRWANCEERSLYVPEGMLPRTQRQFVFWNYWRIFHRVIRNEINRFLLPNGTIRSLEVGCGRGTISQYLSERLRADTWLVDDDDGAVNIAGHYFLGNVIKANALDLPFSDNSFDLVFSTGLAEHIDPKDITKFYEEQYRVLKPGGLMISLNIPHKFSIQVLNIFKKTDYVRSGLSVKDYSDVCLKAGFIRQHYVNVNPFPLFTNIPRIFEFPITVCFLAVYYIRSLVMFDGFYGSEKWSQSHILAAVKHK